MLQDTGLLLKERFHYLVFPLTLLLSVFSSPDPQEMPGAYLSADRQLDALMDALGKGYQWIRTDGEWGIFEKVTVTNQLTKSPYEMPMLLESDNGMTDVTSDVAIKLLIVDDDPQASEYIAGNGTFCPRCGSCEITGKGAIDNTSAVQRTSCEACHAEWLDHYSLTGVTILQEGDGQESLVGSVGAS